MSAPRTRPSATIAAIPSASRRVSGSPASSLITTPVRTGTRMPGDLRGDREDATRRRATRGTDAGSLSSRTNVRRPARRRFAGSSSPVTARRVRIVLEAVPNVSEGRDASAIAAIGAAFAIAARGCSTSTRTPTTTARSSRSSATTTRWSSRSSRASRARSRARRPAARTTASIPRVGAADVVPLVALDAGRCEAAAAPRSRVAERIGAELGLPVFLYGDVGGRAAARVLQARGPRASSSARLAAGELRPDFGPRELDPRSGAALVGRPRAARRLQPRARDRRRRRRAGRRARRSASRAAGCRACRRSGSGCRASGRDPGEHERRSTSSASPLHEVVARVRRARRRRAASRVAGGELVGLVPQRVLDDARARGRRAAGDRRVARARARLHARSRLGPRAAHARS